MIATLTVHAHQRELFMAGARDVIAATRREPGCISYDLTASITDPSSFVFVERWESREALDAHFKTEHLQHWRRLCVDFVSAATLEIIDPRHVDGS